MWMGGSGGRTGGFGGSAGDVSETGEHAAVMVFEGVGIVDGVVNVVDGGRMDIVDGDVAMLAAKGGLITIWVEVF
jgi:hypothetical protein